MVRAIMSDANIQGHVIGLLRILQGPDWGEFWTPLNLEVRTFAEVGLPHDASDSEVWDACQREQISLITANRNQEGPDSLEAVLRSRNTPSSLPVFTIGDIQLFAKSRTHAIQVAVRLLDYLMEIDEFRGAGRLYLP